MTKLIVLAPSAGGKSTLMRYLRQDEKLNVREMDEEVMKANNNKWPNDNAYKDKILVPKVVSEIIAESEVIYLASYVPDEQLKLARDRGFKIVLLGIPLEELKLRNKKRMEIEGYDDATSWLQMQLDAFRRLQDQGLIDAVINGQNSTEKIAQKILNEA